MLPTDIAASLVDQWRHDFNVKLSDFAIGELTRRIATAIAYGYPVKQLEE